MPTNAVGSNGPGDYLSSLSINFEGIQLGSYRMRERIGYGGSASVWKASDEVHDVALKIFVASATDPSALRTLFAAIEKDCKAPSDIAIQAKNRVPKCVRYLASTTELEGVLIPRKEPNQPCSDATFDYDFVSITQCGEETYKLADGAHARRVIIKGAAFELIAGGTLDKPEVLSAALKDEKHFLDEMVELCIFLAACHEANLFHCDIKPDNLFWNSTKDPAVLMIGDWGISQHLHCAGFRDLMDLGVSGTPEYMAPECFDPGTKAHPARDVYALGCCLIEFFGGFKPFRGDRNDDDGRIQSCRRQHEVLPRPIPFAQYRHAGAQGSFLLERLCGQMTANKPGHRLAMRKVAEDLTQIARRLRPPTETISRVLEYDNHDSFYDVSIKSEQPLCSSFRIHHLKQRAVFVFLSLPNRDDRRLGRLFAILQHFFGAGYCCMEVFGRFDFVIRVWDASPDYACTRDCIDAIRNRVARDSSRIAYSVCEDAIDIGDYPLAAGDIDVDGVVRSLCDLEAEAPDKWTAAQKDAARELAKAGALRISHRIKNNFSRQGTDLIYCFCLIEHDWLEANALVFVRNLERMLAHPGLLPASRVGDATIYQCSVSGLGNIHAEQERCRCIITYTAKKYRNIREIPEYLFKKVDPAEIGLVPLLRTCTVPATGYHAVLADGLGPR